MKLTNEEIKTIDGIFENDNDRRKNLKKILRHNNSAAPGYSTTWSYLDDTHVILKTTNNYACFAQFKSQFDTTDNKKEIKFVRYRPDSDLDNKEKEKWYKIATLNGILPDTGQEPHEIVNEGIIIDLSKVTVCQLYVALNCMRYVREAKRLVQTVVAMNNDCDIDFWQAFIFSHKRYMINAGHSFLGFSSSQYSAYGFSPGDEKNLELIRRCRMFGRSEFKASKANSLKSLKSRKFGWAGIAKAFNPSRKIMAANHVLLLADQVKQITEAESFSQAKKIFDNVNKEYDYASLAK